MISTFFYCIKLFWFHKAMALCNINSAFFYYLLLILISKRIKKEGKTMSRKGENIFLRKDGRREARYVKERSLDGNYRYGYVYGKTYLEVKQKRNEILLNLDKKRKEREKYRYNFQYYIENWLNSMKFMVKKSTYAHYTQIVRNHIIPDLGNVKISLLNAEIIEEYINQKFTNGRIDNSGGLSEKSIRDIVVVLRQILSYANLYIQFRLPKLKKKDIKILSKKDQKRLEELVIEENTTYSMGILLTLYTGMRLGEVCALKWSDIDLRKKVIHVGKTMVRIQDVENINKTHVVIDNPKTECSKRDIPINRYLFSFLKMMEQKDKDRYFLTGSRRFIEPRTYYSRYKKIVDLVCLDDYGFHTLRHTFATRCIEIGMDAKTLSEILGHSDVKVTLSLYVHPTNKLKNKYMEKLNPSV